MNPRPSFSLTLLAALAASTLPARAQNTAPADTQNSPLVTIDNAAQTATDDLGRKLPTFAEVGEPKANRWVGVFYWQWHGDLQHMPGQFDMSEYLKTRPYFNDFTSTPPGGPKNPAFYWGQPLFGYYRSTDPWVIRQHLVMLADAGVDFLFLDYTNITLYDDELAAFLKVARELKTAGVKVPKLTFFLNTQPEWKAYALYDKWYRNPEYADMWFRWRGKPLLMSPRLEDASKLHPGQNAALVPEIQNYFTWRPTWSYNATANEPTKWRYAHTFNAPVINDPEGRPEQIVVNKSTGGPIWNGLKEGGVSAVEGVTHTKEDYAPDWTLPDAGKGVFYQTAWDRALKVAPPILLMTGWNEWIAAVWTLPGVVMLGRTNAAGQGHIVDEFNPQFNRDIEPMKGGYGDNYYWQFMANMRRYKGMSAPQKASPPKKIAVNGSFSQWRDVRPEYTDTARDTANRDFAATVPNIRYVNASARNDLVAAKVARDAANISFYARTAAPLSPATDKNWMLLLVDADDNAATGWNGYDLLINRSRIASTRGEKCSIERNVGGAWKWKKVGEASLRFAGDSLQLSVARTLLQNSRAASTRGALKFNFKWADNIPANPDIMDFYSEGDVAPNTRFNYRFEETP